MMNKELIQLIFQISKERNIDMNLLIDAIESSLISALKKRLGPDVNLTSHLDRKKGEINIFRTMEVVEKVEEPDTQIDIKEALKYSPDAVIGSRIEIKEEMPELGRIAAQTAKHLMLQKVRDAEREHVYNEFKDKKGKLISGIFVRREKNEFVLEIGKNEFIIPQKEAIPYENFKRGERVKAFVVDVSHAINRNNQVLLSRTHPNFVSRLFELEVPEISEGLVTIKGVVREPGERSKIAVFSKNKDIDPVGACVGIRGSRVQSVVRELRGEKIDIIRWSEDPSVFIKNALSPAEIAEIKFIKKANSVKIIVPDKHLSLAIGKKGQNVKLASKLTGWRIDIMSETQSKEEMQKEKIKLEQSKINLQVIPGIGPSLATKLLELGILSVEDLANADEEIFKKIPGIGSLKAEQIIKNAKDLLRQLHQGGERA